MRKFRLIRSVYQHLHRRMFFGNNKSAFKLILLLDDSGLYERIRGFLGYSRPAIQIDISEEERLNAKNFLEENQSRISAMLNLFEDDMSREAWNAAMRVLTDKIPIPEHLCSVNNQYFINDIIHIDDNEVFVDAGSFIGDTIQHLYNFAKRQNTNINKVIAFEPDPENLKVLKRHFGKDKKVKIIEKGLYNKEGLLQFTPNADSGKFVLNNDSNSHNTLMVPVTSIDETSACHNATFIKMDIEGSELKALQGAYATIKRNHPKLAICIYHSLEDRIRIAEYIHTTFPEYKIYIRHHAYGKNETVLYAVM